jgi:hypothetical protein
MPKEQGTNLPWIFTAHWQRRQYEEPGRGWMEYGRTPCRSA